MLESQVTQRLIRALNTLPGCRAKKRHGGRFQSGEPDIAGVYRGHAFLIEVKLPGNKLTPLQEHELKLWGKAGATALVALWSPEAKCFLVNDIESTDHIQLELGRVEEFLKLLPEEATTQDAATPGLCPTCRDPWSLHHPPGGCAAGEPGGGSCGCAEIEST